MNINNKITEEILRSGWLEKHCRSVCKNESLADDLMMEIILIILEYKNIKMLEGLYSRKEHFPFIKKIINNQFNSTTSPFWKKYRKYQMLQCEITDEVFNNL